MRPSEELRSYVERVQSRLRLVTVLRGAAVLTASALLSTLVLTFLIERLAFSSASLWSARGILGLILAAGAALGLALPLWRLTQRWSAQRAESAFPEFKQRLLTFTDRDKESAGKPFFELLAADTLRIARSASPKQIVPDAALVALAGSGVACLGVLLWLIKFGPGYWGYGAAALWTGPPASPLYDIRVTPGDATVRRRGDQMITAQPLGLATDQARIYARYRSATRWDRIAMEPQPQGSGFQFLFAGIPEDLEYYVEVGPLRSPRYRLRVADVPVVSAIRVRYHYPPWTRLKDTLVPQGGDLRAVAGTEAELEIQTDRPMHDGMIVLDDGRQIALAGVASGSPTSSTGYRGLIKIERDGAYHIAARSGGETLRISEDYFIEAGEVKPPEVAITRPARDYRASPIEEVTVGATAADAFGLSDLSLHYSVNGGPEKTVKLLRQDGAQKASGAAVISLENLKLVPGDVVSFYAAAKDARTESHTDIAFIQVDPFEREFSQSQQSGGGGGGGFGNGAVQITEREKEVIEATWKQASATTPSAQQAAEQAKFLSDVQRTLRSQALSLAGRVELRDLSAANEAIGSFELEMNAAGDAMGPAVDKLGGEQWRPAIPDEQKALQHLLRAEATFRQIQVAFGSMGGAGSGAPNSAGRDLASLFDLELDMQKNQYETRQDASSQNSPNGGADPVDEALRKLDELARRQDELSAQRNANQAQTAEQRWEQEMLRRQADELRRQLEQLARSGQQGSAGQQSGNSQGSERSDGEADTTGESGSSFRNNSPRSGSQASGSDRAARQRIQEALAQLRQAEDAMRSAVDQHDDAGARAAAQRLREAMHALGGVQQQETEGELAALQREAGRLADEERSQAKRLQRLGGQRGAGSEEFGPYGRRGYGRYGGGPADLPPVPSLRGGPDDVQTMIDDRQKLADDLARLQTQMRAAEREALQRSHAAAEKLRDALNDLDEADTETQLQRSADMLRRGYGASGDANDNDIENSLGHLKDQLGQASEALAKGQAPSEDPLDDLQQLRSRLAALDPALRGSTGDQGGSANQSASANANGGRGDRARANGGINGPVTAGGGGRADWVNGAWNTGNNGPYRGGRAAPPVATPSGDPEKTFRQEMSELGRLRRAVGDDAQGRQEVDDLIRSMQKLDPRRFPGNPAMVEELYARVVSQVDLLELQLRHESGDEQTADVRSDRAPLVPAGYQDAVSEYYRRLSKNP